MSSKIVRIDPIEPEENYPVVMENFSKYLTHRQHDMKGFLVCDREVPGTTAGLANMMMVTGEKQVYSGRFGTYNPEAESPELMRTYVARRNRTTGKMRLVEVRSCPLMHVSHDRAAADHPIDTSLDKRRLAKLQQKYKSKNSCSMQNRIQNRRLDLSTMEDKLKRTMSETVVKNVANISEPDPIENDACREIQAKRNLNAKNLHDLYRPEELIGEMEWKGLTVPAKKVLEQPPEELLMANKYLENKVKSIMQSREPSTETNLAAVRMCLFMDVLARLIGPTSFQLTRKRENLSPFTKVLDEPMRTRFLQRHVAKHSSTSTMVTKYTRDKALMYYMALMFVLEEGGKVSLEMVHLSLGIPKQRLMLIGRAIGARCNGMHETACFTFMKPKQKSEADELIEFLDKFVNSRK